MIYYKPKNTTYSQLCQWIDENAYKDDCDDTTLFQYLYLIIDLLAKKKSYFHRTEDYDDYSIYAATRVFNRLKRYKGVEEKKINYILPYLKTVLEFILSDYIREREKDVEKPTEDYLLYSFNNLFYQLSSKLWISDFKFCIDSIPSIIDNFFRRIPRKKNSTEWLDIKTSVVLTFWNRLKLSDYQENRLKSLQESRRLTDKKLIRVFLDNKYNSDCILIGLDDKYRDYVNILCNELFATIGKELMDTIESPVGTNYEEFLAIFGGNEDDE